MTTRLPQMLRICTAVCSQAEASDSLHPLSERFPEERFTVRCSNQATEECLTTPQSRASRSVGSGRTPKAS